MSNAESLLEDYHWLVSDAARRWLTDAPDRDDPLRATKRLRKDLSHDRARMIIEQLELRARARVKFSRAEAMFFTRVGLEQATGESIADYKAGRFPSGVECLDVCCGIGGDLASLAARGPVVGIDRDPIVALFAEANCRNAARPSQNSVRVRGETAEPTMAAIAEAWHVDPDRRAQGRRTIQLTEHDPDLSWLEAALDVNGSAAIKLAPAAVVPDRWQDRAELEWISSRGECRQLVAWFGGLTQAEGTSKATAITPCGPFSFVGDPTLQPPSDGRLGKYLVEPDAAVLAAGLDAALAQRLALWRFDFQTAYLTGDTAVDHPLAECFEIVEVLPLSVRPLKQSLAARGVGRVEIKKRGVSIEPESLRKKLALRGDHPAILVATPLAGRQVAILVERVASSEP